MNDSNIINVIPLGFPWETKDPFLFCAHHRDEYPQGNQNLGPNVSLNGRDIGQDFVIKDGWRMYHGNVVPGFPYHPHRGFETVTIAKEGFVDHSDSLGAAGRFGEGDVQWMTAGKGVQHSEMFPLLNKDKKNPLEIFQVWLNLPKKDKFVEPHFKMLWKEDIPKQIIKDENGKKTEVDVIAGKLADSIGLKPTPNSWAANEEHEVMILTLKIEARGIFQLPGSSQSVNRNLYFYKGDWLAVDQVKVPSYHSIEVKSQSELKLQAGEEDCYILLLQGKPINEPVVQYGPFVMNTQEEIRDAYRDYRKTQFGGWPWPKHEQVHNASKGRFAKHADGREEIKG